MDGVLLVKEGIGDDGTGVAVAQIAPWCLCHAYQKTTRNILWDSIEKSTIAIQINFPLLTKDMLAIHGILLYELM